MEVTEGGDGMGGGGVDEEAIWSGGEEERFDIADAGREGEAVESSDARCRPMALPSPDENDVMQCSRASTSSRRS